MELRHYLHLVRQRILLVLVTTIVGAGIGYATTSKVAVYETGATIYVGDRQLANNPQANYGVAGLDQIVLTFAQMIPNPVIAQKAIVATGVARTVGQVAGETRATVLPNTSLINVSVADVDPVVAQSLANAIVGAFTAQVQVYQPGVAATPGSLPSEPAYVFQQAGLPTVPLSTGVKKKLILGAVLGLVLSLLAVVLLDYLDISVKTSEELERRIGLPVLGIIPLQREVTGPPGRRRSLPATVGSGDRLG